MTEIRFKHETFRLYLVDDVDDAQVAETCPDQFFFTHNVTWYEACNKLKFYMSLTISELAIYTF